MKFKTVTVTITANEWKNRMPCLDAVVRVLKSDTAVVSGIEEPGHLVARDAEHLLTWALHMPDGVMKRLARRDRLQRFEFLTDYTFTLSLPRSLVR